MGGASIILTANSLPKLFEKIKGVIDGTATKERAGNIATHGYGLFLESPIQIHYVGNAKYRKKGEMGVIKFDEKTGKFHANWFGEKTELKETDWVATFYLTK